MSEILVHIINHSVMITIFVFVMMLLVDYINVLTNGRMKKAVRGNNVRQYTIASLLGATPGCLGAFMNVSLYVHGLLSFGAIVAGMIATSGDEAFVMLSMFPREALLLFAVLFILGILGGWIADKFATFFKFTPCKECNLQKIHEREERPYLRPYLFKKLPKFSAIRSGLIGAFVFIIAINLSGFWGPQTWSWNDPGRIILITLSFVVIAVISIVSDHYLKEHIWSHIVKKHIWKIFLWTFFALLFVQIGMQYWNLGEFVSQNIGLILIASAFIGLIPDSGPHLIFVTMFASGLVPFSVLLTSSIVQDGHGMHPLLSYTVRDSVSIKIFNLAFGLAIGIPLYLIGL